MRALLKGLGPTIEMELPDEAICVVVPWLDPTALCTIAAVDQPQPKPKSARFLRERPGAKGRAQDETTGDPLFPVTFWYDSTC